MKESSSVVNTYRKIMSSTAIFGGAQAVNIVVNIVRGKLVSMILSTTGMGIVSLFNNAVNTIQQFAMLGLNVAAVKNISQANDNNDNDAIAFTVRLVRAMMLISAVVGMVLMVVLSPWVSAFSFGDYSFTLHFIFLGLLVFFNILGTGELTIMQGLRRYKQLAFCSTVPPLAGLLISIPIYYIWRIQGIVPAMILVSFVYFIAIRIYSYRDRRPRGQRERLTFRRIWVTGRETIKLGLVMSFGMLAGTVTTYLVAAFVSNRGSAADVGLYQAANTIATQYIGIIFTAMATDFFPHLSNLIKHDKAGAYRLVNQQAEIALLLVAPISTIMTLTAPMLITILLTNEFQDIRLMIRLMGIAGIFRAACFPMDYIAYANGDKKYIFWIETVLGCTKTLVVMTGFYYFFALDGLGYGALCCGAIDLIISLVAIGWRYGFRPSARTVRLFAITLSLALACLLTSFFVIRPWGWVAMSVTIVATCIYSYIELDKRLNLKALIANWRHRRSQASNANETNPTNTADE